MPRLLHAFRALSIAWLGAGAASLAAQGAPAAGPDSSQPATAEAATAKPPGFKFSGYAEASAAYSNQAVSDAIVGRLYDRYSGGVTLNALKIAVDRPYNAAKLDAGAHADVLIGQNAAVLQSASAGGTFNIGSDGDVTQLFVTLNVPTANGNGVQFKLGKMVSLMGLEVIEDVANPNWSVGNQFIYVENFTSTGFEVDYKFSSAVYVEARVDNGWDKVQVTNGHPGFMGRVGIAAGANTSLGIVGFYGAQTPGSTAGRYGVDVLLNQKVGGKTSIWVQGDYGKEQANPGLPDPTSDAKWSAVGVWLAYDVAPKLNLAFRGDYLDDPDGARTGAAFGFTGPVAQKLWSGTATFNIKTWTNVLVRPEVRYDHSNMTPFNGNSSQATVAFSIAYQY